jgi:hypothetical protein
MLSLSVCAGCTSLAGKRHALDQEKTSSDIRCQEVLDNLALVAHDSFALPAYSSIYAGSAFVQDTTQIASLTTLGPGMAVAGESVTPQFTRLATGNWALDPPPAPEKLEAIRGACQWVVCGPQFAQAHDYERVLQSPLQAPFPGRHFGVTERLCRLPQGWLWIGPHCNVPRGATYTSHSGDTWVWVMPDGVCGLADLTLIIQDIARVDINSKSILYQRPLPAEFDFPTRPIPARCQSEVFAGTQSSITAAVMVDECGNLAPDLPYYRWRLENLGSDPSLRSQISAAGIHP